MKKIRETVKRWMPSRRKWIQLYAALLFNANLKGFITGNIYQGGTKAVCVPGLNCYSCPGAVGACPLGSLQGSFSADRSTLYYVAGILVLYGVLLGRTICGWLCPFGLIQELLHKIKTPKLKKGPVTRILSLLKYVILVFFVGIVPLMYAFRDTPLPAFCKYICPAGTLEGGIALLANKVNASYFSMLGPLFTWKFLVLVAIVVGSVFIFRLFCRFLCPLGALYGFFNRFSLFGIRLKADKCTHCGMCINHCKMDIRQVGDRECIGCGECVPVCPTGAILWRGPQILVQQNAVPPVQDPKQRRRRLATRIVAAVAMVGVLAGAVAYYWSQEDARNPDPGGVQAERGNQVGDLCYGYNLEIVDENGGSGVTVDPTATGKITVINFWGTWCTPCVAELPYFDRIATEYKDRVAVFAIHSGMGKDTSPEYIGKYYPDSAMFFSWDTGDGFSGEYYTALGGRGTYPYTVVLDEKGVIVKIFLSSVHYEDLQEVVEDHL